MEEITNIKISELCSKVCSGGTPKSSVPSYYDGNIPWLNTKEINFNRIYSTEKSITEDGLNNSSAKWIDKNAVIVAMYGATAGKTAISKIPLTTNQACCNLMIDADKADYRFVYYALVSEYNRLASLANGGAQQNLNAQQIKDFEIPFFSLKDQKRIANILSTLDDKIELNRRINDNLEQQAQLLFDNLINASDWSTTQFLSELSEINPPRKLSKGEYAPFVEMSNMPTSGSFPSRIDYKEYNGGMKFRNGDTIMARITPCLENGKAAYVNFLKENEIGFGSTEYIVLAPKKTISSSFLYFLVRNKEFVDYAVKHMNGSSGRQRVSGDTIGNYQLPILDRNKLSIFIAIADRTLSKIRQNSFEIINLAKQRDTLLPKLMSGELKINDLNC